MATIETIPGLDESISHSSSLEHGKEDVKFVRLFEAVEDEGWWGGKGVLLKEDISLVDFPLAWRRSSYIRGNDFEQSPSDEK
jgi:hypothetical protein